MKKKQTKHLQKSNPFSSENEILDHLLNTENITDIYKIDKGGYANVYFLELSKDLKLFGLSLKKGEYAIKIMKNSVFYMNKKQIEYLKMLSNYGLIPKIYYIDYNLIIMKLIKGIHLDKFIRKFPSEEDIIENKITKLLNIWNILGFRHGDLGPQNILVTDTLKVYFIDPTIYDMYDQEQKNRITNHWL